MLDAKKIELKVFIDGKEFALIKEIPSGTAEKQWIIAQGIGDIVAKSILMYTDIKEIMKKVT